ncbi:MAG: PilZ domain-containing protein [Nitrospirota bacterium]
MDRRSFDRVATNLPVKYVCDDMLYSGTIRNISENGMYIKTSNFLPCINWIEIFVPLQEEISRFFARIRRVEKIDDANYCMGIELLDPPRNYLAFVGNLKTLVKSS